MKIIWSDRAWVDLMWWHAQDRALLSKVLELVNDCRNDPFKGLGKPEGLKYLKPYWSRRITDVDRLTYVVSGKGETYQILIAACKGHYTV